MILGNQLLVADRIARLVAEAESDRLASMARRARPGIGWTDRARSLVRRVVSGTPARRPHAGPGSVDAERSGAGPRGVASLPAAGHRA